MAQHIDIMASPEPYVLDLKSEVEMAIKPHADSKERPPFSPAELAVMAWVCERNHLDIITKKSVFEWVMKTFSYYNTLVLDHVYEATSYRSKEVTTVLSGLVHDLSSVTDRREAPMQSMFRKHESDGLAYISTLADARKFLRRALGNELDSFDSLICLPSSDLSSTLSCLV
jgi:hypothetical protein